jgi:hypothetical protein
LPLFGLLLHLCPVDGCTGDLCLNPCWWVSPRPELLTPPQTVGAALGVDWPGLSNAGCGHSSHSVPWSFLDHWLHVLHHGVTHRVVNLMGTGLLLGSNYLSHRNGCVHGPSCEHDHGHSHD